MGLASAAKVSVCIPTFNAEDTLAQTLDSIVLQSYQNIEILVVDNASTDTTIDIASRYALQDNRIKIYKFNENIGGEGNFTRCIQLANGKYTAIFHSDDVYLPNMIQSQVDFLESHQEAGAVFTLAVEIDEYGEMGKKRWSPLASADNTFGFYEVFSEVLKYGNFLVCPSAMVRTCIYQNDIKIWDGKCYATSADLDVWFRILQQSRIGILNQALMRYRVSRTSFSYAYKRTIRGRHDLFLVLDSYVNRFADLLTKQDMKNYRLLIIKDDINRAILHLIHNETRNARMLLSGIFKLENIASTSNWRQLSIILIGYSTFFLSLIPIGSFGRRIIRIIRYSF